MSSTTTRRPTARDHQATVLSTLITSNMPLSRAQLIERTGLKPATLDRTTRALLDAGRIIGKGQTRARRYAAAPTGPHSEIAQRADVSRKRNAVALTTAIQRVGLRDRVWKAVLAQPGQLDEQQLAEALTATPEDIAEAVAWLVDRDRIAPRVDGYVRTTTEATRRTP